ncbi:MAG: acetolactate synthase catalytic subunit [Acuticoccus sp.]
MTTNEMTGGEAIARMILAAGGGPMFGMGGFQLLPFYDAARRLGLDHHLINDERCAVFLADAYAKVSGRVGLADATLGPGATNLVTGLVEALNSGSPLVVVVGAANRDHAGKNMTQETDQSAILAPATKAYLKVETVARVPEMMRRAFETATTGRPGPVVVDVPEDVAHGTHGFEEGAFAIDPAFGAAPALRCRPDAEGVAEAARRLLSAERPIVLAGGGIHISGAADVLTRLARDHAIPVAHTLTGKGAVPCTDAMSVGLFGRYDRIANDLIAASDCILVVGCKLGEIATKRYTVPAADRSVIHLDIVAEEMGRTFQPSLRLWGDARAGLLDLAAAMADGAEAARAARGTYHAEIAEKKAAWQAEAAPRYSADEVPIAMGRLIGELRAALPDDGLFIADGGFAAHWGGLLFDTRVAGRTFVPDRGFASIGYGLPGAMGAKLAAPDRIVAALTGDGGFNMTLGELETAIRMKLAVTIIVVNNAASGYVKALQHLMYGEGAYQSSDLADTNYAAVAEALGARGIRVEDPAGLADAFATAFANTGGPTVLDVVVTRDAAKMLPAADSRAITVKKGDRVA